MSDKDRGHNIINFQEYKKKLGFNADSIPYNFDDYDEDINEVDSVLIPVPNDIATECIMQAYPDGLPEELPADFDYYFLVGFNPITEDELDVEFDENFQYEDIDLEEENITLRTMVEERDTIVEQLLQENRAQNITIQRLEKKFEKLKKESVKSEPK